MKTTLGVLIAMMGLSGFMGRAAAPVPVPADTARTATPIKHLVVIFSENRSFDNYFGTYPKARNPRGEPVFTALPGTPKVNGLTPALLTRNPNFTNAENRARHIESNPFRLDRTQAATASQGHDYTDEQFAYNNGKADRFPAYTGRGLAGGTSAFYTPAVVMGYYDGNTVTALWNYAQHFAMSDNAYGDGYGPSTPGAINLIAGQTNGYVERKTADSSNWVHDGQGGITVVGDVGPFGDICSDQQAYANQGYMTGRNVGDLLNEARISWGWFQGGFDLARQSAGGSGCRRTTHSTIALTTSPDYIPHHEPFQYYASTTNPRHVRPASVAAIGLSGDSAKHQYDLHDFFDAVRSGNFPAVSYLKAQAYQDGHAGYSDPLDEQTFLTQVINFIQQQPQWPETAIIILYDDSDGWYDHQMAPIGNGSFDSTRDRLTGPRDCGDRINTPVMGGVAGRGAVNGRCGPGTRQPFLVISPWARRNYVDHTLITQASVLRFIEDNWLGGRRLGGGSFDETAGSINGLFDFAAGGHQPKLFLDDRTGQRVTTPSGRLPD